MRKFVKYLFLFLASLIILITIFIPDDPAWVDCSDENDLYRYVYDGWKVDKVVKSGDVVLKENGVKYFYKNEYPQIWLSKGYRVKALNFGWRCHFLEGSELNFSKN